MHASCAVEATILQASVGLAAAPASVDSTRCLLAGVFYERVLAHQSTRALFCKNHVQVYGY